MILIVAALRSEAAPLVDHLDLERFGSKPTLWANEDVALVVSGIGRGAASRMADEAARAVGQGESLAWLNVGLAGHRDHELGGTFLASRVEDAASGEVWVPSPEIASDLPRAAVRTVDAPEDEYPDDVLYEMEAAAIFARASLLTPEAPVHAMKIVSDNLRNPTTALTAARARDLMTQAVPAVAEVIERLRDLGREGQAAP